MNWQEKRDSGKMDKEYVTPLTANADSKPMKNNPHLLREC